MSDVKVEGYKTSEILTALAAVFEGYSAEEKTAQLKKNNGIFEFRVKNAEGKEAWWTIDLKKSCAVKKGEAKSHGLKQDVTIILSDETFVELADGKTTGQKAFMTGKLKTKGNMMLATKLDGVLKVCYVLAVFCSIPLRHTKQWLLSEHKGQGEAVKMNCA
ncbi:SCP2 sterol-binding domain-containing protein [Russula ochroleuca]|uniref:SCP2 sterol-binding domain-containing protein n=1 Tax=Russula ochroleuca TaxID=152965 RepID=A0A9P5N4Y3_9AGAM|nr:SCP2 sterol-binding domain-containing protein [Russula ochroleuca]